MENIQSLQSMRSYFNSGETKPYSFRMQQLKALKAAILKYEEELYAALYVDLKKSKEESWVTELGMVIAELNAILNGLKQWMQPERAGTNLLNLPSSSYVLKEP